MLQESPAWMTSSRRLPAPWPTPLTRRSRANQTAPFPGQSPVLQPTGHALQAARAARDRRCRRRGAPPPREAPRVARSPAPERKPPGQHGPPRCRPVGRRGAHDRPGRAPELRLATAQGARPDTSSSPRRPGTWRSSDPTSSISKCSSVSSPRRRSPTYSAAQNASARRSPSGAAPRSRISRTSRSQPREIKRLERVASRGARGPDRRPILTSDVTASSIAELEALAQEHPLREGFRAQLMLALYRGGRQVEALAVYRDARKLLDEEQGLEPGERLQRLERAILQHDPELDAPSATPARVVEAPTDAVGTPDRHGSLRRRQRLDRARREPRPRGASRPDVDLLRRDARRDRATRRHGREVRRRRGDGGLRRPGRARGRRRSVPSARSTRCSPRSGRSTRRSNATAAFVSGCESGSTPVKPSRARRPPAAPSSRVRR